MTSREKGNPKRYPDQARDVADLMDRFPASLWPERVLAAHFEEHGVVWSDPYTGRDWTITDTDIGRWRRDDWTKLSAGKYQCVRMALRLVPAEPGAEAPGPPADG